MCSSFCHGLCIDSLYHVTTDKSTRRREAADLARALALSTQEQAHFSSHSIRQKIPREAPGSRDEPSQQLHTRHTSGSSSDLGDQSRDTEDSRDMEIRPVVDEQQVITTVPNTGMMGPPDTITAQGWMSSGIRTGVQVAADTSKLPV